VGEERLLGLVFAYFSSEELISKYRCVSHEANFAVNKCLV
jgi:hypothetical protein